MIGIGSLWFDCHSMQFIKIYGSNIDRCIWWVLLVCAAACIKPLQHNFFSPVVKQTRSKHKKQQQQSAEREKRRPEKLVQKWNYSCRCDWCHIIYSVRVCAHSRQNTLCTSNQVIKYCLHNNFSTHAIWLPFWLIRWRCPFFARSHSGCSLSLSLALVHLPFLSRYRYMPFFSYLFLYLESSDAIHLY